MANNNDNLEKFNLEWDLNCPADEALSLLSKSVECFVRPWFLTNTGMKGFIVGNKFLIYPNTVFSGLTDIVVVGKIDEIEDYSQLTATARLLPPFSWFPSKQSANIVSGLIMVISWVCIGVGMVTENSFLSSIFVPFFVVTCLYNLIQLTRFIQKPELIDLKDRFYRIFKNQVRDKQESVS